MNLDNLLKWSATIILIIGTAANSLSFYPEGPIISFFGGILWTIISIRMKEPSLIVVNVVMLLIGIAGVTYKLYPNLFT
jgi:hypothetical protein